MLAAALGVSACNCSSKKIAFSLQLRFLFVGCCSTLFSLQLLYARKDRFQLEAALGVLVCNRSTLALVSGTMSFLLPYAVSCLWQLVALGLETQHEQEYKWIESFPLGGAGSPLFQLAVVFQRAAALCVLSAAALRCL